ncbi:unnamed protein product [Symbiodinium sp. CCMP2592]|nr:unnamed protein product [Symbiodinium sp. CCMP2592]
MDFGEALADGSSHRSEASSTSTRELHSQHIHDLQLEVNALRLQVQALRSDLQTLEESLARVWVNQTGATPKASPAAAGPAAANLTEADPDHSVSGQGEEPSDDAASVNAWGLLAPLSPTTHAAVPEESQEDPALWLSEPFSPFAYDPVHDPNLGDPASDLGSYDMVHSGERERSLDPEDIWYDSVRDHSLDAALVEGDREEVATSVAEEPLLPAESLSCKRVFEDARWAEVAQEAKFRRVCQDLPKLPWEQGAWSSIFGPERNMIDDALRSSVQASYGSEEAGQLPPENLPSASAFLEKTSSVVRTRLRRFHLERPADDRREHAIKRLRALIMYDPDTTFLGMVVAKEAANLADDESLSYSFTCAFAKSASGSLIKRAGSLDRFGKWILSCRGTSPLRSSEVDVFAYFSHLQGEGAGATSCQHCVEALRFLHGVAVFQVLDLEEVFSARVLGIVRIMHVTKAPLAQRPPLTVEHLSLLEQFVTMNKDHRACVVGQLVFCAHACARWADSQRVQSLTMECDAESGVVLIVAGALGSKTAISAEARTRLLPYVALGKGVSNVPWAEAWMEARKEMGLQAGGSFLLPTWSERKYDWGDFEMGAAEATNYLREALISMGCDLDEVQDYGSHSMKTTVLTWCGRSTIIPFTEPEQRALGHHLDPTSKSPLTYSREYYLKLYAKVLAVFSTIQQNRFKPDLPGAASVAAMAQSFEEGNERGLSRLEIPASKLNSEKMDEDGESDDSDHASIDLDRELERDDGPAEREVFRGVPWLCNMTSSALESTAEFAERCKRLGLSAANLEVLQHAGVASFGQLCFSVSASPHTITDQTFEAWVQRLWVPSVPSEQQQTCLKKLLFESQTMSMGEIRQKMQPASEQVAKPLPPSERLARSQRQQARITGLVYTPETTPSHYLVDLFNDQLETGVIAWVAPEKCASRADEMQINKKDKALQLMPDGQIKVNSKAAEVRCEASTDSKLRAAWQRRSLAMDMAGIATFIVVEKWVHHLFSVFARDVPEGYAPIQLRQMVNADKRLFMLAAEGLPADLRASRPGDRTPLDDQIIMLMFSPEISQYLVPMPKPHVPPPPPGGKALAESLKRALSEDLPFDKNFLSRAWKKGKGGKGGKGGDKQEDPAKRFNLPEGCCDRNDKNQPLCFLWNQGKCKWKGKGKRCNRGFHHAVQQGNLQKSVILSVFELLPEGNNPRGSDRASKAFVTGAFIHGTMCSVVNNLTRFPWTSELLASYARQQAPTAKFSSLVIFRNNQAAPHRDSHNCPHSTNQVFAITNFSGGRVIVEDPEGEHRITHEGRDFRGRAIDFRNGMLRFAAREVVHWTEPWLGTRVVLVSYTVRGLKGMPDTCRDSLLQARFALPGYKAEPLRCPPVEVPTSLDPKPDAEANPVPLGSNPDPASLEGPVPVGFSPAPVPQVPKESPSSASVGETPFALELFSGRGRLSQCLRRAGFTVLSMDHRLAHSLVPVCKTDLATEAGQAFVWSLLESCCPAFVHMGLPSDTASSRSSSGALRTSQYPLGCPDLTSGSLEATRVDEANRMYRFSFEVACFCLARGIPFCIENPPSSRLWQIFTCFAQGLKDTEVLAKWQALQSIDLHCCMFGGSRAKPLRLKCTPGLFDSLAVSCDKQHEHKPWSLSRTRVEIAEDASYPLDLCRRMVSSLLSFMSQAGQALPSAIRLHDQSLAAAGVQPRRRKPLIPEYKTVVQVPADSPIPTGAKVLSPSQLQGVDVAAPVATPMSTPSSGSTTPTVGAVTLGLWHSPSEFFHKAASLAHPMDTTKPVAMVTKAAIDSSLHGDPDALSEQRRSFLGYLEEKIRRLQPREDALHKGMPKYMQEVLEGKNLLAWEELLKETGYTDLDCVRFMKEGVRLVGCEEHPKDFAKKVSPASLSEEELRATARHRRSSLLGLGRSFPSEEDASLLSQATAEEVDAGFLERGMTAGEVSAFFGHEDWGVVRRFVLVQDGGRKVRPIDDCLEAQINAAYTSTIALQLHDSDYVASLALFIAERMQGLPASKRMPWHGKCLDLSKAYKQMAVHPRDRDLCVIMIQDHDGVATYHICNALMFGASASVFAFVRVSRSLWWIINKCLKVPCACYFDDYPLFTPESSAASVDQDVSRLLDLLGWRHAKSGSKGKPFDSSFDVLGTRLDLGEILSGKIVLANKVGRAEKILEKVSTASLGNGSFRQSLQVLIGHLNFASGFFAGRALRHVAYDLNHLMGKDWLSAKDSLDELGSRISVILQCTPPRSLVCNRVRQPVLVWTDGSWEKGHAGIGAVEWDPIASKGAVWAGHIPTSITALWLRTEDHTQEQIISQVELYAMALIRHLRKEAWMHRRVIVFCDNEAARFAAIKGGSSSHSMNRLVQAWDHPNFDHPAYLWIERVPSFSNIADGPSRGVPEEALHLTRTSSCRTFETEAELETLLFSRRRKEMG